MNENVPLQIAEKIKRLRVRSTDQGFTKKYLAARCQFNVIEV